jgi:hypothetical protein
MTQLPDVSCIIKVINNADGKRLSDGDAIFGDGSATIRYVVVNDSHKPAGPLTIVGSLFRDGIKVKPNGQPNVVPAQQITLQPNQIFKSEFSVSENFSTSTFVAKMLVDVGNFVNEEDETNNLAQTTFEIVPPPR